MGDKQLLNGATWVALTGVGSEGVWGIGLVSSLDPGSALGTISRT